MLAYLFFHRAAQGVDVPAYEVGLRRFHAALAATRLSGFISSASYRLSGGYCDWYLVENSASLDELNHAAVTGQSRSPHDEVARWAVDGVGKLLRLVSGPYSDHRFETRFSKPTGMSYGDLYEQLRRLTDRADVSLWRRMMVLGPPPEFCLLSPLELELPSEMKPETLVRELV